MSIPETKLIDVEKLQNEVEARQEADYNWTFSNGRRYASTELGHYYMPNDEPEIRRLNGQHMILTDVRGGLLHNAPLPQDKSLNILDLGCGTGIWCMQMAEDYPSSKVFGMDVSPIQPKDKPANIEWVLMDFEGGEWPFPEDYFDLIHLRLVHGCVVDWEKMMAKIVRFLAPGGFVEHEEFNMGQQYLVGESGEPLAPSDNLCSFHRWDRLMLEASEKRGRTLQLGPKLKAFQEKSGLLSVDECIYPFAIGTWPTDERQKRSGGDYVLNLLSGIDGFTIKLFTGTLGWSEDSTRSFIEDCKKDLRNDDLRKMIDFYVVNGKKVERQWQGLGSEK